MLQISSNVSKVCAFATIEKRKQIKPSQVEKAKKFQVDGPKVFFLLLRPQKINKKAAQRKFATFGLWVKVGGLTNSGPRIGFDLKKKKEEKIPEAAQTT